jgi:hypothetical protein
MIPRKANGVLGCVNRCTQARTRETIVSSHLCYSDTLGIGFGTPGPGKVNQSLRKGRGIVQRFHNNTIYVRHGWRKERGLA